MNNGDARVASKIPLIQSAQVGYAVDMHGRNQMGVMDLNAGYRVKHHQPTVSRG